MSICQKTLDLSLYLVLDPTLCGGIEGMCHTTRLAVAHGVTCVQLRAEGETFSRRQWYEAALRLKQELQSTNVPLLINDQVDIALAVDADGVHIGQKDLPVAVARRLLGAQKWLGLSVSNAAEIAAVPWDLVDYLGIGPVFPTTSKTNAPPALGLDGLQQLLPLKQKTAVAIGGIGAAQVAGVLASGVEGIAVVSAICGQADIGQATTRLIQAASSTY